MCIDQIRKTKPFNLPFTGNRMYTGPNTWRLFWDCLAAHTSGYCQLESNNLNLIIRTLQFYWTVRHALLSTSNLEVTGFWLCILSLPKTFELEKSSKFSQTIDKLLKLFPGSFEPTIQAVCLTQNSSAWQSSITVSNELDEWSSKLKRI